MYPYSVSISILSQITGKKRAALEKIYADALTNGCVPLTALPPSQQKAYARGFLFKGRFLDIDLMQCAGPDGEYPYLEKGARAFYGRTCTVREALRIKAAFSAAGKATEKLRELAVRNGMSYRTLMRERNRFMKHTALMNLLADPDRGRTLQTATGTAASTAGTTSSPGTNPQAARPTTA